MHKKIQEEIILKKFILAYQKQIDANAKFEIMSSEAVQSEFPEYNNENPDFVVKHYNQLIGIELFELTRNNIEELNISESEKKLNIKNTAHLHAHRRGKQVHNFYLMEDLIEAALDRINNKIQNKLKNYISCPIWLIGYASKTYNMFLISPYFEDNIEKEVAHYISQNILDKKRIEKIFLTEFNRNDLILEVK